MLLFASSSIPGSTYPEPTFAMADKVVHFAAYAIFAALAYLFVWLRDAARRPALALRTRRTRAWLFAILLAVLYGALDELHQAFVPERSSDLLDLLADGLGAVTGATLTFLWAALKAPQTADTVGAGRTP